MSTKCTITFDNNPLGVYYAGQVVSGVAELVTTRPKTIRSIKITISGFAEVRWTENITKQDTHGKPQKTIETYSSTELYYNTDYCVYGQIGGAQLELAAGKYSFPFQTIIPPNTPTSFNGQWGQIQHEVKLIIDRVMRYDNIFKQSYTVISISDLNIDLRNANALEKIDEQTFCWSLCCFGTGPLVMTVNVPYSAYAPGQKIFFTIILDNRSDVHCQDVKVRLMKHIAYTSRSPEIKERITAIKVADNHCGEVLKNNKAEFKEYLQIPSTPPTSTDKCGIIKISYTLVFIAKVSRLHTDLKIEFPLNIGTVPLLKSFGEQNMNVVPGVQPTPLTYSALPQPSYEEDVRSEQFESNKHRPRFPVYLIDGNSKNTLPTNAALYPITPNRAPYPTQPTSSSATISPNQPPYPTPTSAKATPIPAPYPSNAQYPTNAPYPTQPTASPAGLGFNIPSHYNAAPSAPEM